MTWESTLIALNATLTDAIRVINESRHQICLVTDSDKKLAGTITDGDVRRALLRGASMTTPASDFMNVQPFSVTPDVADSKALQFCRERVLRQIPIVDNNGQVVGLHHVDQFNTETAIQENWVVLMAGGTGTRLRPLTENSPKPLLSVGDKPLLEGIIENFVRQGFSQFFISVNYLAESIKDHFGDGTKWGAHIVYLDEDKPLGTAGALKLLPEKPTSPVIVMNGDLVTKIDFRDVLDFHS
ncbi:MAG TPA: alcohol dehydrogenase, partial [Flavobacteriales bacterium]|nr:alcohol dehydrogenase [Flavobacteriales bacterium]